MQVMLQHKYTREKNRENINKNERKKGINTEKYKLMRVLRSLINVDDKNTFILCFYMRRF